MAAARGGARARVDGRADSRAGNAGRDSVAWKSKQSGGMGALSWGLVESVAKDGTLTVKAGGYRSRAAKRPTRSSATRPGRRSSVGCIPIRPNGPTPGQVLGGRSAEGYRPNVTVTASRRAGVLPSGLDDRGVVLALGRQLGPERIKHGDQSRRQALA